jgi:hypothetical protein
VGLAADLKEDFVSRLGMVIEFPKSYPLQQYIDWVNTYGPLWVTTDASAKAGIFSPHARILTKITGTGSPDGTNFTFINPKSGEESTESFAKFLRGFEQMVTDIKKTDPLFLQIVHFPDDIRNKTEGYEAEGVFKIQEGIHEGLTFAALVTSSLKISATKKIDQKTNEFMRGVFWNDDPAILMFHESTMNNWLFSATGSQNWKDIFEAGEFAKVNDLKNLTVRTHYFDLQFLHAMASEIGEKPHDTLAKILLWTEVLYKLSIGEEGVSKSDLLDSVKVKSLVSYNTDSYTYSLGKFFNAATEPTGKKTLDYLLTRNSKYVYLDISRRAIGSLLHLVQDSFARGHVKRTLLNPGDLVKPDVTDVFKTGKYGKFGDVENFHCYRGQNKPQHEKYDHFEDSEFDFTKLDTFNGLIGARDAIDYSKKLLDFWNAKTLYASPKGPKDMFEKEIFKGNLLDIGFSNHGIIYNIYKQYNDDNSSVDYIEGKDQKTGIEEGVYDTCALFFTLSDIKFSFTYYVAF